MRAALLASTTTRAAARRGFVAASTSTTAAAAAGGAAAARHHQSTPGGSGISGVLQLRWASSGSAAAAGARTLYVWGRRPAAAAGAGAAGARRGLAAAAGGGGGGGSSEDPHPHFKLVLPDMGQSTRAGSVTAWRKEEGDLVKNGDVVCEVEMDEFTVGMEIDDKGYLARILVPAGTKDVPVGEPLAVLVYDEKDVEAFNHLAPYRPEGAGAGGDGGDGGGNGAAVEPADGTALLKFIHKLVRGGQIKDKEFAKRLQALARQEDRELLRVFEASFEGPEGTRREADFDAEFFFENARGVLDERDKGGKPVVMAAGADPAGDGGKQ